VCGGFLATLAIYEREQLFARSRDLSGYFLDAMFALQDLPAVADVRGFGLLAGVEIKPGRRPGHVARSCRRNCSIAGCT
jgi:beta-alanine--pyruvate transaminase